MLPAPKFSRPCHRPDLLPAKLNSSRSALVAAVVLLLTGAAAALADQPIPGRLFDGQNVPEKVTRKVAQQFNNPPAPEPSKDNVVAPQAESLYFPIRGDGQPYMLMLDKTVNMTETLNRFYYDPRWRGELWVPSDPVTFPEKATRTLSTWQEYDQQNILRVGNGLARWFEKMSGFGP